MKKLVSSAVIAAAALSAGLAFAADPAAPATVNGQPVKKSWVDVVRNDAERAGQKPNDQAILQALVRNELFAQEAIRTGVDKRADFVARDELKRRELLANVFVSDAIKNGPSEAEMKAEYERVKSQAGDKEYNLRHIQVASEAEAKDLIAQINKGADFATLAKTKSLNPTTKEGGGAMGWVTKSGLPPQLASVAVNMQKGGVTSAPVQTGETWHVMKLDDVRDYQAPAYDKVKEQIRTRLNNLKIAGILDGLEKKAKIDVKK